MSATKHYSGKVDEELASKKEWSYRTKMDHSIVSFRPEDEVHFYRDEDGNWNETQKKQVWMKALFRPKGDRSRPITIPVFVENFFNSIFRMIFMYIYCDEKDLPVESWKEMEKERNSSFLHPADLSKHKVYDYFRNKDMRGILYSFLDMVEYVNENNYLHQEVVSKLEDHTLDQNPNVYWSSVQIPEHLICFFYKGNLTPFRIVGREIGYYRVRNVFNSEDILISLDGIPEKYIWRNSGCIVLSSCVALVEA